MPLLKNEVNVVNKHGAVVDFNTASAFMDWEIKREIARRIPISDAQRFFTTYEEIYEVIFDKEWCWSAEDPLLNGGY